MVTIIANLLGMKPLQVPLFDDGYNKGNHNSDLHWLALLEELANKTLAIQREKCSFEMTKVDTKSTSITADRLFLRALSHLGEERQFPQLKTLQSLNI